MGEIAGVAFILEYLLAVHEQPAGFGQAAQPDQRIGVEKVRYGEFMTRRAAPTLAVLDLGSDIEGLLPFTERQRAGAAGIEDLLADRPGDDAREFLARVLFRQPAHSVPHTYHLGEHLLVPSHPCQDGQAMALPGELRPRPQAGSLRVLLLPRDDIEGLVQMTGVAERISQMPGDQPGERVVPLGVGAAETVFQKAAGFGLIRRLRDERQCRACRRGSGARDNAT